MTVDGMQTLGGSISSLATARNQEAEVFAASTEPYRRLQVIQAVEEDEDLSDESKMNIIVELEGTVSNKTVRMFATFALLTSYLRNP